MSKKSKLKAKMAIIGNKRESIAMMQRQKELLNSHSTATWSGTQCKSFPGPVNEIYIATHRYYYLSPQEGLTVIHPSIPDKNIKFIDHQTPRMSFYTSIDQALMANPSIRVDDELYVYIPMRYDYHKAMKPYSNQSATSDITGEVWFTDENINVQCVGKIKVVDLSPISTMYKELDGSYRELYQWQYKVLANESGQTDDGTYERPILEQANYSKTNCYPVYIVLHRSGTLFSHMVKFVLPGDYTHACISFTDTMDPHYSFGLKKLSSRLLNPEDSGLVVMGPRDPFYKHYHCKYAIYVMYVNKKQYMAMQNVLQYFIDHEDKLYYDWVGAIMAWLGMESKESEKWFCTRFVAKVIDAGYKLAKVPSLWMPGDFQSLENVSLVNQGEDFYRYNSEITRMNLELVKRKDFSAIKFHLKDFPKESRAALIRREDTVEVAPEEYQGNLPVPVLEAARYSKTNCYPIFIVLYFTGRFFAKVISHFSQSEWSHVAISFRPDLDPHYSFGMAGWDTEGTDFSIMGPRDPFFVQNRTKYAIYVMYVNKKQYMAMQKALQDFIDKKNELQYDLYNCISAVRKIPSEDSPKWFCSKFVAQIIRSGLNKLLPKPNSLYLPGDFEHLSNISLVNRGDDFYQYNPEITKMNMEYIEGKRERTAEIVAEAKTDSRFDIIDLIPSEQTAIQLLDSVPPEFIFLTSDWHLFKDHYKKEKNLVDVEKIIDWCHAKLGPNHILMYLGDISFRYANPEDQEASKKIMASLPGHKILILGNHDLMLGEQYYSECGFEHVLQELVWRDVLFTHKPVQMDGKSVTLNIHGHIHENTTYNTCDGQRNVNVYPYFWHNEPVSLSYILANWKTLVKNHSYNPNAGFGEQVFHIGNLPLPDVSKPISEGYWARRRPEFTDSKPKVPDVAKVYFIPLLSSGNNIEAYQAIPKAMQKLGFMPSTDDSSTCIKLHFGEPKNKNCLPPGIVKLIADEYHATLVDACTAYGSKRDKPDGHRKIAKENGYDFAPVEILDYTEKNEERGICLGVPQSEFIQKTLMTINSGIDKPFEQPISIGMHLTSTIVGQNLENYKRMIVYSHFKGHSIAGFGGAFKNIGMGCATGKNGKLQIHGMDWSAKGHLFMERLVESASAIMDYFDKSNMIYVNVLANLSTCCDCEEDAPEPQIPDIGILVSDDIVAIEQASFDLVKHNQDSKYLMEQIADKSGYHQIEYATWLALGSKRYVLYDFYTDAQIRPEDVANNNSAGNIMTDDKSPTDDPIDEAFFFSQKDFKYRSDEFKSGKIRHALILGFSGAGKTSLANELSANNKNIVAIELDDMIQSWRFTDEQLKEYDDLVYQFFRSSAGSKYRVTEQHLALNHIPWNQYEVPLLYDLFAFIESYTKTHIQKQYIIEGVWPLYYHFDPSRFKDWCVMIKGTSFTKALWRAAGRDRDKPTLFGRLANIASKLSYNYHNFGPEMNRTMQEYIDYYQSLSDQYQVVREGKYYKESAIQEKWEGDVPRSELPKSAFGIPDQRKYPLDSETHVRSAIKLFGHAPADKKKELARRIAAAAKKYDIAVPETTQCYKMLHEAFGDPKTKHFQIPFGVKNLIFDLGGVLIDISYGPETFRNNENIPPEYADIIYAAVKRLFYHEDEEIRLKIDKMDIQEAKRFFRTMITEDIHPYIDDIFDSMVGSIHLYPRALDLLIHLKEKGYKLYYFSNWAKFDYYAQKPLFDQLRPYFDGGLYSWQTDSMKPIQTFYQNLMDFEHLQPEECMFFDDHNDNLATAKSIGWKVHHFDPETSYNKLMDEYIEIDPSELGSTVDNQFLIDTPLGLETVDKNTLGEWFVVDKHWTEFQVLQHARVGFGYSPTLPLAIERWMNRSVDNSIKPGNIGELYVFVPVDVLKPDSMKEQMPDIVPVGKIAVTSDGSFEWIIEYPLYKMPDNRLYSKMVSNQLEAMAISGFNPVRSGPRYFMINTSQPYPNTFALMTDPSSNRAMVVNDNNRLEVVSQEMPIEAIYEFTGPIEYIDRLNELYKNEVQIDNLYTALTGRLLITEDQIECDSDFKKINLDLLAEQFESEAVTVQNRLMKELFNIRDAEFPYLPAITEDANIRKYQTVEGDISIKEDLDGFYYHSNLSNKRSRSVPLEGMLTEEMLISIL